MSIKRAATSSVTKSGSAINDVPDAPTVGTPTDSGDGTTASVPFTAAATGGGSITSYTVTSSPGGFTGTGASSPISVTGLTAGTAYTFTVTATNSSGTSGSSSASSSLTLASVGSYFLIERLTVGAGGTSGVVFSSIPQTYKHLQIRAITRMNGGGNYYTNWYLRPNNDSTSSMYSNHYLVGNGSTASSAGNGLADNYLVVQFSGAGNTTTSNIFGASIIDVLDYTSTTKLKTFRQLNGVDFNSSSPAGQIAFTSQLMNSTSAITSINVLDLNGYNFSQYSTFALYGIKGA